MRKSVATEIASRRLDVASGRASNLVQRAAEAGVLPTAVGSAWPDLSAAELASLLIAVVADRGLGGVGASVREFTSLTSAGGDRLVDDLAEMFSDGSALLGAVNGSMVVRLEPASVSLTAGGVHRRYGPEPPPEAAGKHVVIPGRTLAAIGLEFGGRSPAEADALVALARASRALDLSAAFSPMEQT